MKQLTLTLAFLCAACALTLGGPEPLQSKEVVQPVQPSCFEGWYFGVHGGGVLSNSNASASADEDSLGARSNGFAHAFDSTNENNNDFSGEGGLHAGYNWQRGGWIFGIEVDISAAALDEHQHTAAVFDNRGGSPDLLFVTDVSSKSTVDWYSTLRPRFGHTLGDRIFVYGTGGLAFGKTELEENTLILAIRPGESQQDRRAGFNGDSGVKFGWTAGAGVDFCLSRHVTLNFTYLYIDLDDSHAGNTFDFTGFDIPRSFHSQTYTSSDNNFHVFQGGLSFKF